MQSIVESKVFTDEQKVSIIKAVVEKNIVLGSQSTFKKSGDYYYIKDCEHLYSYVMTFNDGFQYLQLELNSDEFFNSFEKNKMQLKNIKKYVTQYHIVLYNKETIFPYMAYDFLTLQSTYINEGKNAEFIKGIIKKGSVANLWNLIEYAAKNDINLVSLKTDEIVDISYNNTLDAYVFKYEDNSFDMCGPNLKKEQNLVGPPQKEKDEFMLEIDKLEDSATMKKNIEVKKVADYKRYIISQINISVRHNHNYVTLDKNNLFSHPEITEFLQYICTTKKFTIAPNGGIYKIYFF